MIFRDAISSDPDQQIVEACSLLLAKADELGLRQSSPWSIADLRLGNPEYEWLNIWVGTLSTSTLKTSLRPFPGRQLLNGEWCKPQSALGIILIAFMAEHARRYGSEGELWPCIARAGFNKSSRNLLFISYNNQPTAELKDAIEQAARDFGLRHVFGIEGMMSWFNTIYLQIGLTERGIERRLPDWLAGAYPSLAARMLYDDPKLKSTSFMELWKRLLLFRKDRIDEAVMRAFLRQTGWIRGAFIDQLLHAAKQRSSLGTWSFNESESIIVAGAPETVLENALSQPEFTWLPGKSPAFRFRIDRISPPQGEWQPSAIKIGKMLPLPIHLQRDGCYLPAADTEICVGMDNPTLVSQLLSTDGEVMETVERTLYSLDQEVIVFTEMGRALSDPWNEVMSQGRTYYLLLTSDLDISIERLASYKIAGNPELGIVYRLPAGWNSELEVTLYGDRLWQPLISRTIGSPVQTATSLSVRIIPPNKLAYGEEFMLRVVHPVGTYLQFAHANGRNVAWKPVGASSTDIGPCVLDASKKYPINVSVMIGLKMDESTEIIRRSVELRNVAGAAFLDPSDGWKAAPLTKITVRTAKSTPLRVGAPPDWRNGPDDWAILEGDIWLGPAPYRDKPLGSVAGFGAAIALYPRPFNLREEPVVIADEVCDPGIIESVEVLPSLAGNELHIKLTRHMEATASYNLVAWMRPGQVQLSPVRPSISESGGPSGVWTSTIVDSAESKKNPIAVGIAFNGVCLGSWWSDDWSGRLQACNRESAATAASMIHWLKLPLISAASIGDVRDFVDAHLPEVIPSWIGNVNPPCGLDLPGCSDLWYAAISTCFVTCEPTTGQLNRLIELFKGNAPLETLQNLTTSVSRIDVFFMARLIQILLQKKLIKPSELSTVLSNMVSQLSPSCAATTHNPQLNSVIERICAEMRPPCDSKFMATLVDAALRLLRDEPVDAMQASNVRVMLNSLDTFRKVIAVHFLREINF
jgi:hypothetical protein